MPRRRRAGHAWFATLLALVATATPATSFAASTTASSSWAAARNAFTYAGEYQDPQSQALYLRRRWYHPALPSFLSRDPVGAHLARYGYAGGNPQMNVDPTGGAHRSLGQRLDHVNAGVGGHFARVFVGQFLMPLQIVAHPRAFWDQMRHDTAGVDIFLGAGIAVEALSYVGFYSSAARTLVAKSGLRYFWGRTLSESLLGAGQTVTSSLRHGRLRSDTLMQGLEATFGPEIVYRIGIGIGYQPFSLDSGEVDRLVGRAKLREGEAVVFRVQERELTIEGRRIAASWTSPFLEGRRWGVYHDALIAVTNSDIYVTEYSDVGFNPRSLPRASTFAADSPLQETGESSFHYAYIGKLHAFSLEDFNSNPRNYVTAADREEYHNTGVRAERAPHRWLTNNCHHHVAGVLKNLGMQ